MLLLTQVPIAISMKITAADKAINFVDEVIMLDMTKYEATLDSYSIEFPSWILLPLFLTATLIGIVVRKRLVRT